MMQNAMTALFGVYRLVDGQTNWEYIGGVAIFCICLWSFFRLLGMVFKK